MKRYNDYKQKTVRDLCVGASTMELNKFEDIILAYKNKKFYKKRIL